MTQGRRDLPPGAVDSLRRSGIIVKFCLCEFPVSVAGCGAHNRGRPDYHGAASSFWVVLFCPSDRIVASNENSEISEVDAHFYATS